MFFSDEDLEKIEEEYIWIDEKFHDLTEKYVLYEYRNERSQEYAKHGFSRRLGTLTHCLHNIFRLIPPERTDIPAAEEISDVTINIQAFVFNAFGCLDNLAWIWVKEADLTMVNGSDLPNVYVGLREKNKLVRASFRPEFREYLKSIDKWIGNLEDFRHALAHRIPLYIPPYCIPEDNRDAYEHLEKQKFQCSSAEWERLDAEQMELCHFAPIMQHSFGEKSRPIVFHAQVIADFNTIIELGLKILEELTIKKADSS